MGDHGRNTGSGGTGPAARPGSRRAGLTYAESGVSIEAGDRFAHSIVGHMRRTHGARVIPNDGGFAGLLRLDYNESLFKRNYKDPVLVACTDGVGTKITIATAMRKYDTIGIDLVAMNVNDLVVQSAEPLLFLDYIACGKVDQSVLVSIVSGIAEACRVCDAALLGGETAEMPGVYGPDDIDLAGFAVGVVELGRVSDPARVEAGDIVIGLESDGVHSNGFSLVRAVIDHAALKLGEVYPDLDATRTLGEMLLTPTRLYAAPIVKLLRRYRVKKVVTGMAHITGGGLAGNLERALHPGVDAIIDAGSWTPHPVFPFLQSRGSIADEEMARVFNMGIGFCLIVRPNFAESIAAQLERFGERPRMLGRIVRGSGAVQMKPGGTGDRRARAPRRRTKPPSKA
jgi:phosphoribosylformylglycinamidine cyclo-ligase